MALEIAADVVEGRLQRVAHAGLGGEVQDARDGVPVAARERRDRLEIGDVGRLEGEAGVRPQTLEPRPLQRRVIVAVEVVDAEHRLAAREQGQADVEADEAGAAGDQNRHGARTVMVPEPSWWDAFPRGRAPISGVNRAVALS